MIYTAENRGPKLDPCVPALTDNQFDDCPVKYYKLESVIKKAVNKC